MHTDVWTKHVDGDVMGCQIKVRKSMLEHTDGGEDFALNIHDFPHENILQRYTATLCLYARQRL